MKKKRPWLRWTLLVLILALIGAGLYLKKVIDEQPQEITDPGIPDVSDLPDPDDVE